jgi:hypothetical protein
MVTTAMERDSSMRVGLMEDEQPYDGDRRRVADGRRRIVGKVVAHPSTTLESSLVIAPDRRIGCPLLP